MSISKKSNERTPGLIWAQVFVLLLVVGIPLFKLLIDGIHAEAGYEYSKGYWHTEEPDHVIAAYTIWLVLATGLLALFTGALFVATYFLWRATLTAVRDANESADRQAIEFKDQLAVAARAAAAAEAQALALKVIEGPIIAFTEGHIEWWYDLGGPQRVPVPAVPQQTFLKFVVRNFGRTAAYVRGLSVNWLVADEFPKDPVYEEPKTRKTLLAPGDSDRIDGSDIIISITQPEQEAVGHGWKKLLIWGYVRYEDMSGDAWDLGFSVQVKDTQGLRNDGHDTYSFLAKPVPKKTAQ